MDQFHTLQCESLQMPKPRRPPRAVTPEPPAAVIVRSRNIDQTVVVVPGFLSGDDVAALCRVGPRGRRQEHDRSDELDFEHAVWRCEAELDADAGAPGGGGARVHARLLDAMRDADRDVWRGLPGAAGGGGGGGGGARASTKLARAAARRLHPETEFIVYDADAALRRRRRGGGEAEGDDGAEPPLPGIGPHVDNGSCVTLIAMLSDRARGDFEGGVNRFEDGAGRGGIDDGRFVELRPELGDIVIFRGEACEHSLTPVTRGVRRILQIEFCRMKEGRH